MSGGYEEITDLNEYLGYDIHKKYKTMKRNELKKKECNICCIATIFLCNGCKICNKKKKV